MAETFGELIAQNEPTIASLLPEYLNAKRFFALLRQMEKNPKLMECTPQSLLECVMKAAECGFEIGGPDDHCYVIPYGKQAQLQAGWKGVVYRLVQAHAASHIFADLVREGDEFRVMSGTKRELIHVPAEKRGKIIKAYAVAVLPNGITDFEVFESDDIDAIEKAALRISGGKPSPAWSSFRGEMIKKSVIKRLGKRLQGDRRASPDELDRLRATMELRTDIDVDRIRQAESANADLPDPPRQPRQANVEVVPDKKDEPIDDATQQRLMQGWTKWGHKVSELSDFLKTNFDGIKDLSDLKKSQVASFEEFVK